MYQSILIPTDGSKAAEGARAHAINLAATYGATLHVLFVVDTDAIDIALGTEQVQRIKEGRFGEMKELEQTANDAVGRIENEATKQGVQVQRHIAAGSPRKKIVQQAEEQKADLIVMSSHGRSGVRRMLLGSVTERVIRLSTIPVLVVPVEG